MLFVWSKVTCNMKYEFSLLDSFATDNLQVVKSSFQSESIVGSKIGPVHLYGIPSSYNLGRPTFKLFIMIEKFIGKCVKIVESL